MVKKRLEERIVSDCIRSLETDDKLWSSEEMIAALNIAATRIRDLVQADMGFFVTVIAEPLVLGNAFMRRVEKLAGKEAQTETVPLGALTDSDEEGTPELELHLSAAADKPRCLLFTGVEETWARLQGSTSIGLPKLVDKLQAPMRVREGIHAGQVPHTGAFVLLPPRVAALETPGLREADLGERLSLAEGDVAHRAVGEAVLAAVSKASRSNWPDHLTDEECLALLETTEDEPIVTPGLLLSRLQTAKQKILPQKITKELAATVKDALDQLSVSARVSYAQKRDLVEALEKMPLVDLRPVIAQELRKIMASFESSFETDLRKEVEAANLILEGTYPDFRVSLPVPKLDVEINVVTPYSAVKVRGRSLSTPTPQGVVDEIKSIRARYEKGRPLGLTQDQAAKFLASVIDAVALSSESEDVLIDEMIALAVSVLEFRGFKPFDENGIELETKLKAYLADARVFDLLSGMGWHPHTGRSGGIVVDGKQYALFSRSA